MDEKIQTNARKKLSRMEKLTGTLMIGGLVVGLGIMWTNIAMKYEMNQQLFYSGMFAGALMLTGVIVAERKTSKIESNLFRENYLTNKKDSNRVIDYQI